MPDLHLPDPTEGYADERRPLAPYLALTTAFNAAFAACCGAPAGCRG